MTTRPAYGTVPQPGSAMTISDYGPRGGELPVAWLDQLLLAWREAPYGTSLQLIADRFVSAIATILTDCAIGICIALPKEEGGPVLARRAPNGIDVRDPGGPSRLFMDWAYEHVAPIPSGPDGSTLHCASMAPLPETGAERSFLDQAAKFVACALRSAHAEISAGQTAGELSKLKAQVVQSQKLAGLGQIAAGIVHELNNPLTSIVAYSDYLQKKAIRNRADSSDIERLRRITEAAERIRSFTHDLVAYARPSNEASAPVAINSIIDRALVFCEHVLGSAEIEVERRFAPGTAQVSGTAGQLTQVFVNLVTNACHAMAERGGRLTLTTEPVATGWVRIHITDTGHGIPEEHLPRLFDPFFTTKADGRGTGLGLAIVHDIVMAHGGTIRVESELGAGTSFILELPTTDRLAHGSIEDA